MKKSINLLRSLIVLFGHLRLKNVLVIIGYKIYSKNSKEKLTHRLI